MTSCQRVTLYFHLNNALIKKETAGHSMNDAYYIIVTIFFVLFVAYCAYCLTKRPAIIPDDVDSLDEDQRSMLIAICQPLAAKSEQQAPDPSPTSSFVLPLPSLSSPREENFEAEPAEEPAPTETKPKRARSGKFQKAKRPPRRSRQ
jgi:hypothetical protein